MSSSETIRRSKIYTYFYGRNTVFQQFLILVGVFFLIMAGLSSQVEMPSSSSNRSDILYEKYQEAQDEYYEVKAKYKDGDATYDDYIEAQNDYNDAYDAYRNYNYSSNSGDDNVFGGFLSVLGGVSILVGIFWILFKVLSFNREGERDYDEELSRCVEEAKRKGLEKLNIVSDQIERVEPVVLNGVARIEDAIVPQNIISRILGNIVRTILLFDKFILGAFILAVFSGITTAIATNLVAFIIMLLLGLAGIGAGGFFLYKKFEIESYVSPRTIARLTKFTPNLISKLGSDDSVRVSLPAITVYMFGDDQLYMYYQYIDIVTGRIFCEGVHEYFYEDIVGITSSQETKKIFKRYGFMKLFLKSIDYLKESITVVSSGCTHKESYIVDIGHSLLDTQFIGMRNLIRQKKAEK